MRITRRHLLRNAAGASAGLALPWGARTPSANAAAGGNLKKYVQPLPVPGKGIVVATPSGLNQYAFTQNEITRQLHPDLPPTPIWAYDDGSGLAGQAGSFGMAVIAQSGTPLTGQLHAPPADDLPGMASGRHAANAARRRGAGHDPSSRGLCCGRQRR